MSELLNACDENENCKKCREEYMELKQQNEILTLAKDELLYWQDKSEKLEEYIIKTILKKEAKGIDKCDNLKQENDELAKELDYLYTCKLISDKKSEEIIKLLKEAKELMKLDEYIDFLIESNQIQIDACNKKLQDFTEETKKILKEAKGE